MLDNIGSLRENDFQRFCSVLLSADDPSFQAVNGAGGDMGNDGFLVTGDTLFQAYAPTKETSAKLKKKIDDSIAKATDLRTTSFPSLARVVLLTPFDLTHEMHTYLRDTSCGAKLAAESWGEAKLASVLARNPGVRSAFPEYLLPDIVREVRELRRAVHGAGDGGPERLPPGARIGLGKTTTAVAAHAVHAPFQAGNKNPSLVVLGPRVVAEGWRVAASQSAWKIRIDRFLLGNDAALSTVGDRLANLPPDEHFVVLNDPDDAREVTGTVRWTRHHDYYEVHVPVASPRLPQTVRDRESIDLETMRRVKGAKAGATALQCWLGQGVGHLGDDDRVGCWLPLWWPIASLVEHRDALVRMEIVRLAGVPRLMSEYTGEVSAPLDFVDRVISVSVRRDDREEDHFTASVELFMIGAKDLWSGTIMLATELPPPFEDIMAGLLRQVGGM